MLPALGLAYLLFSCRRVEHFIDGSHQDFKTIYFSDNDRGGDSKIVSIPDSNRCCLTYRIGDTTSFPFVGCGFTVCDSSKVLDLSQYKSMKLLLDSSAVDTFTMSLNFLSAGSSSFGDEQTHLPLMRDIVASGSVIEFPISELNSGSNWQRLSLSELHRSGIFSLQQLATITFESHERFLRGDTHSIGVVGVVLVGDRVAAIKKGCWFFLYSLLPLIVYLYMSNKGFFDPVLRKLGRGSWRLLTFCALRIKDITQAITKKIISHYRNKYKHARQ